MRIRVLGPVSVSTDSGESLPVRPQTRRLMALLLAAEGRSVSVERIVDALDLGGAGGAGVRMALSRLRSIVGERLETTSSGYRLVPGDGELDARVFEASLRTARTQGPSRRRESLGAALALWCGDAYGEFGDEPWATAVATRLMQAQLGAVEDLADAMLASGMADEAALLLHANLEALRYRERAAALLMEALAISGRVTDALRAYQDFRNTLVDDIGIEPSGVLRGLEADLLANDGVRQRGSQPGSPGTAQPGNLMDPASSFVGRSRELAAVDADMSTHRLVSLVGAGGVGKTRIAIAAARAAAASVPDGLWFVDLAPLLRDDSVAHATASTLGARAESEAHLVESLVEFLRGRAALLIFDNCEHVLPGAASVIGALVGACPSLRVLATSREALGVLGECVHSLGPLDVNDSVELFGVRAAAANRHVEFDEMDRDAIAQICRRVDGMPLSIELVAMRMKSATPVEILERLDDIQREGNLGQGRPDRQRTTRAVVEWSYGLLNAAQQALFDRLSVFAGSFGLDAAAAVCEFDPIAPGATSGLLAALVDKSMVVADVGGRVTRYRLLDTLRQVGHDHVAEHGGVGSSSELRLLFDRHARHYTSTAKAVSHLYASNSPRAIELLDEDWDNWRVAVRRAIGSDDVPTAARIVSLLWPTMITFRTEIATWVTAVRERLDDSDPTAPWIYLADAQWTLVLGDPAGAIDIATRGNELGLSTTNMLWSIIAEAQTMTGKTSDGFAAALMSLDGAEGELAEGVLLGTACRCAWAYEPTQVRPWAERLCAVAAANGRTDDRARAAHAMGIASLVDNNPEVALAWFEDGREAARGIRGLEAEALQGVARATAMLGGDGVEPAFLDALTALRQDGQWMYTWVVLEGLMIHWVAHGRVDDGSVLLGHLEAHGKSNSVDAPRRRETVERVRADVQLARFMQRGATMSATELLEFAIHRLT